MDITFFTIVLGIAIGLADTIPMIKQKINIYYTVSAFLFHLIMPTIVNNVLVKNAWWQSTILYFVLTLPLSILVFKNDKKDSVIMTVTSIVVGSIVGLILM